jgi:hypothetical protein
MKLLLIITCLFLASCSSTKRFTYEASKLQTSDKYHARCTLVNVKPGAKGYRHTFVSDRGDTLRRIYFIPLKTDSCYMVWKTKLEAKK